MKKNEQPTMIVSEVASTLDITRQHANRLVNSGMFGPVSNVPVDPVNNPGQTAKAVSGERVLTYLEERTPPAGTITLEEAATQLGVSTKRAYILGTQGHIELVEYLYGERRKQNAVRIDSIDAYRKRGDR